MPVQVTYEPTCDQNFRQRYESVFLDWVNRPGNANLGEISFDQAHVLNGLHPTTSQSDPNPIPHVTVRLSNARLRDQNSWYILHWRPNDDSVILPKPDSSERNEKRRADRKKKKQRQLERKREEKREDKDKDKKDPSRKDTSGSVSSKVARAAR